MWIYFKTAKNGISLWKLLVNIKERMKNAENTCRVTPHCCDPNRAIHLHTVQFSCSVMSDSLEPIGLQHARLPCPSPTPRASSNSCPLSWWCHPTISSSLVSFSFCLQSFPASGGQSIGAPASVLPMNIQDWFPLGLTGLISLQSKRLAIVFSNTTV